MSVIPTSCRPFSASEKQVLFFKNPEVGKDCRSYPCQMIAESSIRFPNGVPYLTDLRVHLYSWWLYRFLCSPFSFTGLRIFVRIGLFFDFQILGHTLPPVYL